MRSINSRFTGLSTVKTSILGILSCARRPSSSLLLSLRVSIVFTLSSLSSTMGAGGERGVIIETGSGWLSLGKLIKVGLCASRRGFEGGKNGMLELI